MRVYINAKEVPVLISALSAHRALYAKNGCEEGFEICETLLDRISLCLELQNNEQKGGKRK